MSYISVDVDIDIDEIIWSMSKRDRRTFFIAMKDEGYISESCVITDDGEVEALKQALYESNDEFNQALQKLFGNGWKLTKEEEDYIINLSKRFI